MKKTILICAVVFLSAAMTIPTMARFDAIVPVAGDTASAENEPGWMFARDLSNATPFAFNFDAASLGFGSLYVEPIGATAAHKFIGEFFMLSPLADVQTISYDFQIGAGGDVGDASQFYMNVYANFGESAADKFYDCRYTITPTAGSTTEFTTVTFDPTASYAVTTHITSPQACPASPADMGEGATLRVFSLNLGDTSASDVGLDGYFDNVVVSQTTGVVAYDFGPTADTCRNGGWELLGSANQGQCIQRVNTGK